MSDFKREMKRGEKRRKEQEKGGEKRGNGEKKNLSLLARDSSSKTYLALVVVVCGIRVVCTVPPRALVARSLNVLSF